MHIRKRSIRSAAIALLTAAFILEAAACGGSSVVKPVSKTDEASPSPAPETVSEVFAAGVKQAILEAVDKTERLGSAQLSFLVNPGAQFDENQSKNSRFSITYTQAADPGNSASFTIESSLDASTGDASMVTSIRQGGETAKSGGIYFTGNTMLIKKADAEQPMIRHTLDPAVASSFRELSASERFTRVLADTTRPKMSGDDWSGAIDAYLETVAASAGDADYVSEQQETTLAGSARSCTATTLSLTGEAAVSAVRGLVSLISRDSTFKSFFVSQYEIAEDTYGVTGLDGVIRDIDALTPEERADMSVTFKTLQGDKTSAVYLAAASGERSMSILFKFFRDGSVRENDIVFTGFDGGGVKLAEQNVSAGGNSYTGQLSYSQTSPGGVLYESIDASTSSTITDADCSSSTNFTWYRQASDDMDEINNNGTIDYTQQTTAQGTAGQASWSFASEDDPSSNAYISVALEQFDTAAAVTAPQFLEGSGISSSDQSSLYNAMSEGFEGEMFSLAPVSTRMLVVIMAVFM